jgi:outer membrane protein TolC
VRTAEAAGTGTRVEELSAESQLANDRTLLPPLRQRLSQARHGLALLVGRAPASWSPPDFDLAQFTLPARLPVALPSALVHDRPDILAAEAELHAATAQIGVATAAHLSRRSRSRALAFGASGAPHLGDHLFNPASLHRAGASPPASPSRCSTAARGSAEKRARRARRLQGRGVRPTTKQAVLQAFGQVADLLQRAGRTTPSSWPTQRRRARGRRRRVAALSPRLSYARGGTAASCRCSWTPQRLVSSRRASARSRAERAALSQDTVQLFVATAHGWSGAASADPPAQSAATP